MPPYSCVLAVVGVCMLHGIGVAPGLPMAVYWRLWAYICHTIERPAFIKGCEFGVVKGFKKCNSSEGCAFGQDFIFEKNYVIECFHKKHEMYDIKANGCAWKGGMQVAAVKADLERMRQVYEELADEERCLRKSIQELEQAVSGIWIVLQSDAVKELIRKARGNIDALEERRVKLRSMMQTLEMIIEMYEECDARLVDEAQDGGSPVSIQAVTVFDLNRLNLLLRDVFTMVR